MNAEKIKPNYHTFTRWENGQQITAHRLEVQSYISAKQAINLGAAFAIGFWFVTIIPVAFLIFLALMFVRTFG